MTKTKLYSHVFMAFGKARETKEFQREYFKGVAALNILAVNPTRAEQNQILKSETSTEPINYVDTAVVKDAKGGEIEVPRVRITFITRTDPKIACNNGIETTQFVSIFLTKGYLYSHKDGVDKIQVIDRFGRTAWATAEDLKEHKIPMNTIRKGPDAGKKTPASLDKVYHPAYLGEAELIDHLRKFMNFPRPDVWDNDKRRYVMKTDAAELKDCESVLEPEDFEKIFKGDVSVIRDAIMGAPLNAYKLMFGVRIKNDGTLQQAVYTRLPVNLAVTNYKDFETALLEDAAANPPRHPDTSYKAGPLEKYSATPTDYSTVVASSPESLPEDGEVPAEEPPMEDLPADTSPFPTF